MNEKKQKKKKNKQTFCNQMLCFNNKGKDRLKSSILYL